MTQFVVDADLTAHQLDQLVRHGKTESGGTVGTDRVHIDLRERLEERRLVGAGDAESHTDHLEADHHGVFVAVLHDQLQEHLTRQE